MELRDALARRRSCYAIGSGSPVSDACVRELVELAVTHVPSAFNSQTSRLVLLLGKAHARFWEIVEETLRPLVPAPAFDATRRKIRTSFSAGHGTVLFFEEQEAVKALQGQYPLYADSFPVYSEHTSAMHQLAVWMLLEEAGFGASLQHYNPLVDDAVRREFALPASWKLVAQMPFGVPLAPAGEKSFRPLAERVLVVGGDEG